VVDVDCAVGKAPCLTAHDDNGYQIDEAEVAYWGRCPECLKKSRRGSHADRLPRSRQPLKRTSRTKN
jgi:Fur family ferric uptake transcriptional regulator